MEARFYFDLVSAEAYLVAERILHTVPGPAEWMPVLARELPGRGEAELPREEIERRARERDLLPVKWPARYPTDTTFAMRAAVYAKGGGRSVAYAQAAFRQAYAGGRDLADEDTVLLAAAACEMHPRALLKGLTLRGIDEKLAAWTAQARDAGVRDVPAVVVGNRVFHGDAALEEAAAACARATPTT